MEEACKCKSFALFSTPNDAELSHGARMYLCICHAVTDSEVRRAAREREAATAAQYFRGRGLRPRCRHCAGLIQAHIKDEAGDGSAADHATPSDHRD